MLIFSYCLSLSPMFVFFISLVSLRLCVTHLKVRTLHSSPGDEAGLRSVMIFVDGDSTYGWLRMEAGVHRLVRNSPYDPAGRRHTSFSQVRVYPETSGGRGQYRNFDRSFLTSETIFFGELISPRPRHLFNIF